MSVNCFRLSSYSDLVNTTAASGSIFQLQSEAFTGSGQFYFVPKTTFAGDVELTWKAGGVPHSITLKIATGHSSTGPNAVSFGATAIDYLRLRHRLNYLNYPGASGQPLALVGVDDAELRWATGLFNAAITGGPLNPQATQIRRDWINAPDVPPWVELSPGLYNPADDGFYIHPNVDGSPQSERWASEFAQTFIASTAVDSLEDSTQDAPLGQIAVEPRLELRRASLQQGGNVGEVNGAHHGGLQLDIETAAANSPSNPFFAVETIGGVRDVGGSQPGWLIFHLGSNNYVEGILDAGLGRTLSKAVQVEISGQTDSPLSAWNNYPVLLGIRSFLAIRRPRSMTWPVFGSRLSMFWRRGLQRMARCWWRVSITTIRAPGHRSMCPPQSWTPVAVRPIAIGRGAAAPGERVQFCAGDERHFPDQFVAAGARGEH